VAEGINTKFTILGCYVSLWLITFCLFKKPGMSRLFYGHSTLCPYNIYCSQLPDQVKSTPLVIPAKTGIQKKIAGKQFFVALERAPAGLQAKNGLQQKQVTQQKINNMNLKSYIREYPDFPEQGVLFKDISPILRSPDAMRYIADKFYNHFKDKQIDIIAGAESRGLIFASALAARFDKGFIMVRKPGKLPGAINKIAYEVEYGKDIMEIQQDAISAGQNVWIVDDLLATGGTAKAAAELVEALQGNVVGFSFVIELEFLKGREKIKDYDIQTLITYDR
jgi:adenine phosphoribosyltransferase